MLRLVIRFSIGNPFLVLLLAAGIVVAAGYRMSRMPVDVFPELNAPTVVIMTEAGGLAADEVEQFVTVPIESAVGGLSGVRRLRSASAIGLSMVWVDLEWNADVYRARQLVDERLGTVRERLPDDVHVELAPISSVVGEIMLLSLSSPDGSVDPLTLRSIAEFEVRTQLLAVPGVAQAVAIGGEMPEYQVHVDPERLRMLGLTVSDVVDAARGAHSLASGGYLPDAADQELPLRQQARVRTADDIAQTLIELRGDAPITIGDVADVALGPAPSRGRASESGHAAVMMSIKKSPGTNTLDVTRRVDAMLATIDPVLPEGVVLNRHVMRQSDFIDRSIENVLLLLRDAVIIVTVILMLFLLNVRTTLITLTALPISLAAGLLAMDVFELGLNVMTLGGLAVAVGVLVDDAIIDVENVHRRLRENRARPEGARRGIAEVVFEASNEIRPAMVFATVIIMLAFGPLLFLQGLEGRFFRPLGLTYVVSILASLLVALTVTPALCRLLLGRTGGTRAEGDGPLVRQLKRLYEPTLLVAIRRRKLVLGCATLATIAAIALTSTFGTSFLPTFNEGTYTVFLYAPPGTSLNESDRMARGVEERLSEIEGVRTVARRTGRGERDEHAEPVNASEIEVTVQPTADRLAVRAAIDDILGSVPGIVTQVGQPIEHRLSHVLSGTPAAIAINVFGDDLAVLRQTAQAVAAELRGVPGARDVNANREVLITSIPIRYRADALAAAGLRPADAAEQVRDAIDGARVAVVNQDVRQYDVVVRLAPDSREDIDDIRNLLLRGRGGAILRLRDVADIGFERTSNLITREQAQRKAVVSLNVAEDANLGDLVKAVRARAIPIIQGAGYTATFGGQFEAQQSASRTLFIAGIGMTVVILLLLQVSTGSMRAATLVLANLPLALIGGVLAIFATEGEGAVRNLLALMRIGGAYEAPVVSIASMVGFVTLFGIAVRNGILLVNHYNHLIEHEGASLMEAVRRGSMERLVPILMTAISAALGLLPLALASGEPGSELLAPLAIVVLGGIGTSTFLNLVVVPAGFVLVFRQQLET